jgi:hypothetical protein
MLLDVDIVWGSRCSAVEKVRINNNMHCHVEGTVINPGPSCCLVAQNYSNWNWCWKCSGPGPGIVRLTVLEVRLSNYEY